MKLSLRSVVLLAASAAFVYGDSFVVGMEDTQYGGDSDYNDILATLVGSVTVHTTGVFTPLNDSVFTQSVSPFWNHASFDGVGMNVGNFVLGDGGFSGGPIFPSNDYLSTVNGGSVSFYFTGDATITVVGGITADNDILGVCPLVNCNASNTTWINGTLNYSSADAWQLIASNNINAPFTSFTQADWNAFALFKDPPVDTPEPTTISAIGVGFAALAFRKLRKR
jgi:hypothetical protein